MVTSFEPNDIERFPWSADYFLETGVTIPPGEHIAVCPPDATGDWGLVANLARQYHASVMSGPPDRYLIIQVAAPACVVPPGFVPAQRVQPEAWALYVRR